MAVDDLVQVKVNVSGMKGARNLVKHFFWIPKNISTEGLDKISKLIYKNIYDRIEWQDLVSTGALRSGLRVSRIANNQIRIGIWGPASRYAAYVERGVPFGAIPK